eukprot:6186747-Pleurochrysis_carterae.AAC.1
MASPAGTHSTEMFTPPTVPCSHTRTAGQGGGECGRTARRRRPASQGGGLASSPPTEPPPEATKCTCAHIAAPGGGQRR